MGIPIVLNRCEVIGWLAFDPEIRTFNGKEVATLVLKVEPRYLDKATNEWQSRYTEWIKVELWEHRVNPIRGLKKGDDVWACGEIRLEQFEHAGEKKAKLLLKADKAHGVIKPAAQQDSGYSRDYDSGDLGPPA